ncbi:MAG: hydantoinase/oxoprolinase family protein, partial [Acidobacteria bacterium]|nr:hydantoinase/oxoprolinase family protein [Acidobacteriota bacterium]
LLLGRLDADYFLGGTLRLNSEAARRALLSLAEALGSTPEEAALAVIDIANENMVNALRVRTVEVGIDPRAYCLVAFGGAGALHASAIARRLGITRVLVPPHPGLCSAFGALTADLRSDQVASVFLRSKTVKASQVRDHFQRLALLARRQLEAESFNGEAVVTTKVAMRYAGQNYEHEISLPSVDVTEADLRNAFQRFEALHEQFYGYQLQGEIIEIIGLMVTAVGRVGFAAPRLQSTGAARPDHERQVRFRREGTISVPVHDRNGIAPGWSCVGPAIVEDADATSLIEPGDRAMALTSGALLIDIAQEHQ